jgi:hypothetical protein
LFLPTTATATIKSAAKKKGNGEREREREREKERDEGEEGKTRTNKERAKLEQNRTCDLWETKDTLFGQSAETFFHACPEPLDTVINK